MKYRQFKKIIFPILNALTCLMLFFSPPSKGASLTFKYVGNGYAVNGVVNKNDLKWADNATFWAAMHTAVHETGQNYYEKRDTVSYCSSDIDEALQQINERLSKTILVVDKHSYADNRRNWTATINCKVSANPKDGGWQVITITPSPPNGAVCDTSVPLKVSFGTLAAGSENITTVMDGTIKCDRDADVSLSFRGFDDGYIPVQDAKVKFSFDNGAPTYKLTAQKGIQTNFKVNFQETSTGTTTGYKSASAVLVMQWQ